MTQPSDGAKLRRGGLACGAPPRALVDARPRLLRVPETLLDVLDRRLVARVLAHVVADLHCVSPCSRSNLDHNVQRDGLGACGGLDEVVYSQSVFQIKEMQSDVLVK
jgi:hypothetical protein